MNSNPGLELPEPMVKEEPQGKFWAELKNHLLNRLHSPHFVNDKTETQSDDEM
jgi:hypothetical protein